MAEGHLDGQQGSQDQRGPSAPARVPATPVHVSQRPEFHVDREAENGSKQWPDARLCARSHPGIHRSAGLSGGAGSRWSRAQVQSGLWGWNPPTAHRAARPPGPGPRSVWRLRVLCPTRPSLWLSGVGAAPALHAPPWPVDQQEEGRAGAPSPARQWRSAEWNFPRPSKPGRLAGPGLPWRCLFCVCSRPK